MNANRKKASSNGVELPIVQPVENGSTRNRPKSGRGRLRACVLIAVHLVLLAHIAHYWIAGRTVSPLEPSEAMYTIELGLLNAGTIFFGLAIVGTAVFGRFFCGWGCHVVALQDLSGYLMRRVGFRPKPLRSRLLVWLPFGLAFYMFFWPTVQRLWFGRPHPGFSNHLMTESFWVTFPGPAVSILTFAVCGGLMVYLLGNKGFCTYACPYGAFFSVSDRLAFGRIRVTDACQHCGQCTAHCTSNVKVHAEVREFGMVVDTGCMKCMDCVSVCPNDALYYGLTSKLSPENSSSRSSKSIGPSAVAKTYDFSLAEELAGLAVAGITIYAVRGLYNITPLLLSVAVGAITAYLAIQFLRALHKRDLRAQSLQLKRNGRITKTGFLTLVLLTAWFGFVTHSFFVQYHRHRGGAYLSRIPAAWDELLLGTAQAGLTQEDHENIRRSLRSYQLSDRLGLVDLFEVKLGLAVGNLMQNDLDAAEKYLRQAYDCDRFTGGEMLREFLVTHDRQEEAAKVD